MVNEETYASWSSGIEFQPNDPFAQGIEWCLWNCNFSFINYNFKLNIKILFLKFSYLGNNI